jgi:hypothetical protein
LELKVVKISLFLEKAMQANMLQLSGKELKDNNKIRMDG